MGLKGTKTEKNILTAFAGESQARNRYTYFTSQAKKDGPNPRQCRTDNGHAFGPHVVNQIPGAYQRYDASDHEGGLQQSPLSLSKAESLPNGGKQDRHQVYRQTVQ